MWCWGWQLSTSLPSALFNKREDKGLECDRELFGRLNILVRGGEGDERRWRMNQAAREVLWYAVAVCLSASGTLLRSGLFLFF